METVRQRHHKKFVLILVLAVLAILFMYWQRAIFNPFLLALVLAYILNPVIKWMTKKHIPRKLSILIVFLLLLAAILNLIIWLTPVVMDEMRDWYIAV